jgi:hypothetical protein
MCPSRFERVANLLASFFEILFEHERLRSLANAVDSL